MTTAMYQDPYNWTPAKGTVVNCDKEGHCFHEGTAVGSLYCCKCGSYKMPDINNFDNRLVPSPSLTVNRRLYDLVFKGLQDIQEGRVKKIPNIRALKEDK